LQPLKEKKVQKFFCTFAKITHPADQARYKYYNVPLIKI
jgi:hypothetical protein